MSNNQTLLLEAYTNLGFKLSENRFQSFLDLIQQHMINEDKIKKAKDQHRNLRLAIHGRKDPLILSIQDAIDMASVNFIQLYGDQLWPVIDWHVHNRGHLNDRWYVDTLTVTRRCDFVWVCEVHQDCERRGNHDRSLWEEKIRSPLGLAVRKYIGVVQRMWVAGELVVPTEKVMDELVAEVVAVEACEMLSL